MFITFIHIKNNSNQLSQRKYK
ncbi:hypothetical protein EG348_02460 [Chryseobacterium sp. G0201]|nr:hypothetical protein EG348_02460 [Chryseobacterium sp. G0201]